jgi:transcriptional regulator GlxA family with amidase domain
VAEISIETGFGSVSNFNRRFLSLKRTSPLRYRKTAKVAVLPRASGDS